VIFVLLGAVTMKGNDMTFGLTAINFVVTKVIFLCLIVCLFFLLNVEFGLLIINTSNSSDITGLTDLISYNFL
jgi:hypothetical protein